ncbi:N-acetyltransferase domain-containing protein [Mycena venus]|uniref:N-acetyltransferase domain-containing protein n=1 Tax=Mycena venus TaxID=2733690 RepID=A0A8H6XZ80_9AGAR|nr:N-acetyltransferase domain-containing protein [Mycena venus]
MTTPSPAPSAAAEPVPDPLAGMSDLFTVDSAELRAQISARTPILFTPAGEPYLALPAPFERFYLSPERVSDVPADIAMMSDIRVARTLVGPPFPVSPLASKRWLVRERAFVTALFTAYAEGAFRPAACYPFTVLRERLPDGVEEYVGQVTVMYAGDGEKRRTPVNEAWEEWRMRTKVFEIGAALRPEWHRKGLATAAVRVAMHDWAIPQMGCTELRAECLASNIGSVKIWQKYGFVEDPELRTEVKIIEAKGGGVEQGCVLIWSLK